MIFDTNNDCSVLAIQKPIENNGGYEFKIISSVATDDGAIGYQIGNSIGSDNGNAIALNGDGSILALTKQGSCEAYRYQDGSWIKYGNTMFAASTDANVNKICINDTGDIIVILECSDEQGTLKTIDIPLVDSEGQPSTDVTGLIYQRIGGAYNNFIFPSVPVSGGSGSGATADVTLIESGDDEIVSNIKIINPGSGYLPNDILSIEGTQIDRISAVKYLLITGAELVHLITEGKQDGFDKPGEYTDIPLYRVSGIFASDTGARVTVTVAAVVGITSIIVTTTGDVDIPNDNGTFESGDLLTISFNSISRFTDQDGDGQHDQNEPFGDNVKISLLPDAIDNPNNITFRINQDNINTSGEIQTFQYMAGEWNSYGETFQANSVDNITTISLDSTGNILAIGKPSGTDTNSCGEVAIYAKTTDNWSLKGSILTLSDLERASNFPDKIKFGYNIELNKDGTIICIASNWGQGIAGSYFGQAKRTGVIFVYRWLNERWQKLGGTIDLNEENQLLGYKIAINGGETDIIFTTLTNKYNYLPSTAANPDSGDPSRGLSDDQIVLNSFGTPVYNEAGQEQNIEQKLITFKYDSSIDADAVEASRPGANLPPTKILGWNMEIMPEIIVSGSQNHESAIKLSDLGHKICYFYKQLSTSTYNFIIHNWPAATLVDTVTTTDVLDTEIKTTSDVKVEGTLMSDVMKMKSITTDERNALTAEAGMIIFNSTDNKHQAYNGTSWNNLY